ncbi:Monoacylglycerol lipase ABHD12 [Trichinella sp. T8]|nr:Monoacylglycerol lipase ABHD12 [Trichinella sp. T8]
MGTICQTTLLAGSFLVFLYGIVPLLLYLFPNIELSLIFMSAVNWPFTNYSDPRAYGVKYDSRNFYLTSSDGIKLGVWHMLPKSLHESSVFNEKEFGTVFDDERYPVVLYFHGNTWSRCASHRIQLYNIFTELNYHVVAFDYRGFADSTGSASEEGMNKDAHTVYQWIRTHSNRTSVLFWGHSLGTAVATRFAADLCLSGNCPLGLVLEAPFNNMFDAVKNHPFTSMYRWHPWFAEIFTYPLLKYNVHFKSDEHIKNVYCPILILHAEDDNIIPSQLARQLHEAALSADRDSTFKEFSRTKKYGHKFIVREPELPTITKNFVKKCTSGI